MTDPTFDEITGCQKVLFEWADSYDAKDWQRLRRAIAPTLKVDYRSFLNLEWEALPADDFVEMASSGHFLGNPMLKTQHFIGLSKWEKVSNDEIMGTHQVRVAHQKYADSKLKEVAAKGHDHGTAVITYRRIDGEWKFAGLQPQSRWSEFDMDQIFSSGGKPEAEHASD